MRDRQRPDMPNPATTEAQWQAVVVPRKVMSEGRKFLTPGQYLHATDLVKQLVGFGTQRYDRCLKIEPLEEFWELKDKGGVLGKINLRIYFYFVTARNQVVVLCAYKKEDDNQVPPFMIHKLRSRLDSYLNGDFGVGAKIYKGMNEVF